MRDVLDEFNALEKERAQAEKLRPQCYWCGAVIWQEKVLKVPRSGVFLCERCISENEQYIEEVEE